MSFTLGKDGKLYSSDTLLSDANEPVDLDWTEQDNVRDLSLDMSKGSTDVTTRGSGGWREQGATLKEASVEFGMIWRGDDTFIQTLRDAFLNDTEVTLAILDGDESTTGSQGLAGNFQVTNFPREEELEERMMINVTVVPSSQTQWWTVTS